MLWRDYTESAQKSRGTKTFKISCNEINITITNDHVKYPHNWVLYCAALDIGIAILKVDVNDYKAAQAEALDRLEILALNIHTKIQQIKETNLALG